MRLTWRRYDGEVCPRVEKGADIHYIAGEFTQKVYDRLAAYEDAEEQGRLVMLPCKVGDKVRDKIADHIFTIQTVELGHKAGTLFRAGNPGTDDYAVFYDFEIGERFDVLGHEEAEAALKGGRDDV